ncbi:hypothetical protein MRS44_005202 [Fusarium solani]|uniref:uncharacterized protein n=1 Tax=Fusarium solani TaxID=169388 RepID=UPI0032C3E4F8|nr:hypothetical protein MRS44_005202 [Fusarium solani]
MESDDTPQSESARARDFIAELGGKNGFVEEKYWDELSEAGRAKFQRAISSLQGELEPAIKALAQSLYSSTARFVFELLQNAEDNNFLHAEGRPYVSFHLRKDQLVIECNEDGFTPANLEAICSIGKSSKSATKGYIGEKGIGFKSVFMAAWRVHIQSGPYSFYFQHRPSDGGLGMITPIWQEPTEELPRHMTRTTLYLHTEGDPQSISAQRDSIRQQLRKLNGNVLLFMRNLEEIRTIIEENESKTSTVFSKSETDNSSIRILKTVTRDDSDSAESSSTLYHVTKHRVHNLSKNENRTYSEEEDRLKEYSTAEVVLAFPLTPEHEPVIESQEVFAFLPVQPAGFSFLIQSDFMTNASREHIVTTAARNIGLRDGICSAFVEAALRQGEKKAYTDFWSALVTNIEAKVRETPLIRPDSGGPLRLITSLANPCPQYVDEEKTIFCSGDLTPELRISRHYGRSSLAILENLGLFNFNWLDFIRMVDQDLQSADSWIKARVSDDYLQTKVAHLLHNCYANTKHDSTRSMIEKLPIIHLRDGRWLAATAEEKVFFPDTAGLAIPEDLEFSLVDSSAAALPERRKLFECLGVVSLSVNSVRERVFQRHKSYAKGSRKIRFYEQQLKFLYSTHDSGVHQKTDYDTIFLIGDDSFRWLTGNHDVYLPDDNPLGPRELLKPIVCDDNSIKGAPGFKVVYLHESYLQDVPQPPRQDSLTWRDWLVEIIGVRRLLRLTNVDSSPADLSQACYYVSKHRPEKFVAFLVHHWPQERNPIITSAELQQKLRKMKVLCQGGQTFELEETYLPFPDLLFQSDRFLTGKADFPYLQLEQPIERKEYSLNWASLTGSLGIKSTVDLAFYLRVLLAFSTVKSPTEDDCRRAFELYSVMHGNYLQTMFKDSSKQAIQSCFKENRLIIVPSMNGTECIWAPLTDCLWEAPPCLRSRHPLKARMKALLVEFTSLPNLFVDVLEIPDCDYSHIMRELEYLSDKEDSELEIVSGLYKQLSAMSKNLPTKVQEDIKSVFVNKNLIYAEKGGHGAWHQVAKCLWASESELPGWAILEPHYRDLYKFFVNFLGVKTLSVEPNIWILNSYISAGSQPPDPKTLLGRRIFPVRYPDGHVQLETARAEFAIIDRTQLGDIFKPMAKTLDFDLDQVRRLGPTLNWLGLGMRHLSEAVREVSRIRGASEEPLSTPAWSIKPRAHALYRIAYHYNSPRLNQGADILYETLKNAQVYETDGIAATLYINQDGHERSYEKKSKAIFTSRREEGSLTSLFLAPRGAKNGSRAVLDEKGLRITASVLNSNRFVLSDILEDEGIAHGELEDDYEEVEETKDVEGAQAIEPHIAEETRVVGDVVGSSDEDPIATSALAETEAEETPGPETPVSSRLATPGSQNVIHEPFFTPSTVSREVATGLTVWHQPTRSRRFSGSDLTQDVSYIEARSDLAITSHQPAIRPILALPALVGQETAQYQALLERVVAAARGSPRLPSQGAYDMTGMSNALSDLTGHSSYDGVDQFLPFRSSSQQERDRKIGAAGELYVFELLKNLSPGLPGFSLQNWRSTIRKYVTEHPDYTDIQPWNHRETSDLEYNDSEGALTELMIDNGYLERDIWENKKPRYYLEVKTTTGPCEAPFYMSKSQYRLIHECQDSEDKIYVVFRVYEVEKAAVQLRVYVNPARLERSGHLTYTAETWSVRPGTGA